MPVLWLMWHPQEFNPPPCSAAPRLQVLEAVVVLGIRSTNVSMSIIAVFITCLSLFSGGHVTGAADRMARSPAAGRRGEESASGLRL